MAITAKDTYSLYIAIKKRDTLVLWNLWRPIAVNWISEFRRIWLELPDDLKTLDDDQKERLAKLFDDVEKQAKLISGVPKHIGHRIPLLTQSL